MQSENKRVRCIVVVKDVEIFKARKDIKFVHYIVKGQDGTHTVTAEATPGSLLEDENVIRYEAARKVGLIRPVPNSD